MSRNDLIIRYVMGELNEVEQHSVEEQYFADPSYLREIQAVCDDLIDDYLNDEMSVTQRRRFEQRLKQLPFLSEHIKISRAFLQVANNIRPTEARPFSVPLKAHRKIIGTWSRAGFFRIIFSVAGAVAALILMAVGITDWLKSRQPEPVLDISQIKASPSPLPEPKSTVEIVIPSPQATVAPSASGAISARHIASLVLSSDLTRGSNEVATLSLPKQNGLARVQLELLPPEHKIYQARLQTSDGKILKTWFGLSPVKTQSIWFLTIDIPAQLLTAQKYVININAGSETFTPYRFEVQR